MTEAAEGRPSPPQQVLGFWMCLALVMGNMIGTGFYLLPAALAPFGWNGVFGWLLTIAGALCLAVVFANLSRTLPAAGGPYAYSRSAFGPLAGFLVAWSYWCSLWVGNVAIATGVVAPLATLVPGVEAHSVLVTCALVWTMTAINCLGVGTAGRVQLVTTIAKFVPLAAVVLLAAWVIGGGGALPPLRTEAIAFSGETGIAGAAALTLWAFLGLESATVPAEKVTDPGRTIARATLIGTLLTGLIYLFACSSVALLLPPDQAAQSGAPLADFVARYGAPEAGRWVAFFAVITALGALNGWILLQGEMPWAMARDGVFPRFLTRTNRRGAPVAAHLTSSLLLTIVLLLNYSKSLTDLFRFLILLATTASLVPYLICSLAALRLGRAAAVIPFALLGALYALWAIWGAGVEAFGPWLALTAVGMLVYLAMRRSAASERSSPAAAGGGAAPPG